MIVENPKESTHTDTHTIPRINKQVQQHQQDKHKNQHQQDKHHKINTRICCICIYQQKHQQQQRDIRVQNTIPFQLLKN